MNQIFRQKELGFLSVLPVDNRKVDAIVQDKEMGKTQMKKQKQTTLTKY